MASPYSFAQQEHVLIALTRFFCSSAKSKQEFKFQKSGFIGIHAVSLSIISELVIAENCTESYYLNNPSENASVHLIRLTSRMKWFPVVYHLVNKVALVVFAVLGYHTGKYHLNDTMAFLWLMAAMPVFIMSVIWGINEVWAWMEMRKKKPKLRA